MLLSALNVGFVRGQIAKFVSIDRNSVVCMVQVEATGTFPPSKKTYENHLLPQLTLDVRGQVGGLERRAALGTETPECSLSF